MCYQLNKNLIFFINKIYDQISLIFCRENPEYKGICFDRGDNDNDNNVDKLVSPEIVYLQITILTFNITLDNMRHQFYMVFLNIRCLIVSEKVRSETKKQIMIFILCLF